MANDEQVLLLTQGEVSWNEWRRNHPNSIPDLSSAELQNAELSYCDLRQANLRDAVLMGADLRHADLREADLRGVKINDARAPYADFTRANLQRAYLWGSDFREAIFRNANLREANLRNAQLVQTDFRDAKLAGTKIYGISAWDLKLEGVEQSNLILSAPNEPDITVDNLEVAQFIYLLLNNEKLRQVIDTVTSKAVLILGRFTEERKAILDAIRDALRQRGYLPILFDFEKPSSRDLTETISTLAHMARFIIADVTEAKSIPQELQAIVPNLPSVPVQPLLLTSDREYGMFEHFKHYPWVLDTYYYKDVHEVLASLEDEIISPAETKASELVRGLP